MSSRGEDQTGTPSRRGSTRLSQFCDQGRLEVMIMYRRLALYSYVFLSITLAYAQSRHDQMVISEINAQLDAAFKRPGDIDLATRIQFALAKVTAKRDEPGKSTNEELRDTEYYLHGLYGASAKDWKHIGPALGVPVYNAFKWAALRCSDAGFPELEKRMRTQPNNPISEPGGTVWAYRGLKDGLPQDGKQSIGPRPSGHGLLLPALQAASPCVSH
jgi:hypothetical protein